MSTFDRVAKHYNNLFFQWFYLWAHKRCISFIKDCIKKNSKILDVACGTGNFLGRLEKLNIGLELFGLDESQGMIVKACKKFKNINFLIDNAENLPFTKNYFDLLTIIDAFYYFKNKEKIISECSRVLKSGGYLFIFYPAMDLFPRIFLKTIKIFSKLFFFNLEKDTNFISFQELKNLTKRYGFKLIKKELKSLNWFFLFQKD